MTSTPQSSTSATATIPDPGRIAPAPATRAEVCVTACADIFRYDGESIASAFGTIPAIGARLARHTFAPDLQISDGEAYALRGSWPVGAAPVGDVEAWLPYRAIFDLVWNGKRHVMMIPSQVDQFGNTNISAIGEYHKPKAQLLGVRGGPGNSVSHPTSYWVPRHSRRVFVAEVDMVSGVGNDRAAQAGAAALEFHDLRRIVTDLAVLDYDPTSGALRLMSVHPGVTAEQVQEATGFSLQTGGEVPTTRLPTDDELQLIRELFDPRSLRDKEVSG